MLRSTFTRHLAQLGAVLPFTLLFASCGDGDEIIGAPGRWYPTGGSSAVTFGGARAVGGNTATGGRREDDVETGGRFTVGGFRATGGAKATGGPGTTGGNPANGQTAGSGGDGGNAGSGGDITGDAGAGGDVTGGDAGAGGSGGSGGEAFLKAGPPPVILLDAEDYVVLAMSRISNVPTSDITGDLGLSPAAASYITGFTLTKAGAYWTATEVDGQLFAADNDPPTPINVGVAIANMMAAYTDAETRPTPDFLDLGGGDIGGLILSPGLYHWDSTVTIPTDVTLQGASDSTWIFQVTGDLDLSSSTDMILEGGAQPANIVWQVAGQATFGTGSHAEGVVLSKTAIVAGTGASINGRLMAQTAVDLAGVTIVGP